MILLPRHANKDCLRQVFQAGASAYLLSGAELSAREMAFGVIAMCERYLTPAVAKSPIDAQGQPPDGPVGPLAKLTRRHRKIL